MAGLEHITVPLGQVRVGDLVVDPGFSGLFGKPVTAIFVNEDSLSPQYGKQVSLRVGTGGITARETYELEVLR